ncbi:hypothetical protein PCE1_003476 [Barthelona sp. PCE]
MLLYSQTVIFLSIVLGSLTRNSTLFFITRIFFGAGELSLILQPKIVRHWVWDTKKHPLIFSINHSFLYLSELGNAALLFVGLPDAFYVYLVVAIVIYGLSLYVYHVYEKNRCISNTHKPAQDVLESRTAAMEFQLHSEKSALTSFNSSPVFNDDLNFNTDELNVNDDFNFGSEVMDNEFLGYNSGLSAMNAIESNAMCMLDDIDISTLEGEDSTIEEALPSDEFALNEKTHSIGQFSTFGVDSTVINNLDSKVNVHVDTHNFVVSTALFASADPEDTSYKNFNSVFYLLLLARICLVGSFLQLTSVIVPVMIGKFDIAETTAGSAYAVAEFVMLIMSVVWGAVATWSGKIILIVLIGTVGMLIGLAAFFLTTNYYLICFLIAFFHSMIPSNLLGFVTQVVRHEQLGFGVGLNYSLQFIFVLIFAPILSLMIDNHQYDHVIWALFIPHLIGFIVVALALKIHRKNLKNRVCESIFMSETDSMTSSQGSHPISTELSEIIENSGVVLSEVD